MARTPEELQQALAEQRQALSSSCSAYDAGALWEARRIATTLVNLFHSKGRTKALLEQVGLLENIRLFTSAEPNPPGNVMTWSPLIAMQFGGGSRYVPLLGNSLRRGKTLSFQTWWAETVYEEGDYKLSRGLLLRTLRDQDGGSHYDPEVSDEAYKLMKDGAGWFAELPDGTQHPVGAAELATARQIAFEVECSLQALNL